MVEYETLKPLHEYLMVKNMPKKHWNVAYEWEIGKHIHLQDLKALKVVVTRANYFLITYDEVTSIDNQWLYVHIYVVDAFPCCYLLCRWSMGPMVII
jgi:hypothetical protein